MNKGKIIKRVVLIAVAGLAIYGGYRFFQKNKEQKNLTEETHRTASVTKGDISSSLSSSGTISPKDTYNITSLVEGEIISADFEEGDQVEKDQVLYVIDASSMESEIKLANSSLERAKNNYEEAVENYEEVVNDYSGNTYKSTRTGFIKELKIEAGDKVNGNTEIAAIYSDQTMEIKVPFLNTEAAAVAVGSEAIVTLTDTEETLPGIVKSVSNMDEVLEGGRIVRYITVQVANPGGLTKDHTASVAIGSFYSAEEGNFEASIDTVMKAEVPGNASFEVEALLVNEGDFISVGTPIFKIKDSDVEDLFRDYKDSVDAAEENVETSENKIESTQDDYDNYTIKAPISGKVITKNSKAGDKISRSTGSASTTMAVIYDLSEVTFQMSIDELDIKNVKVGQKVEVTADALEGQTFNGTVTNVSLESVQSNGVTNYPVTVTLDEVGDLLPGMNVDGTIILENAKDATLIPINALLRGDRVYVKDENAKGTETEKTEETDGRKSDVPDGFKEVKVEVGLTNDDYVQILSGVSEGDEVYVNDSEVSVSLPFGMGGGPEGMDGNRQNGGPEGRNMQGGPGGGRP